MRHTYATPMILIVLLSLAGCTYPNSGGYSPVTERSSPPTITRIPSYLEDTAVVRQEGTHSGSVVDTALDWAQKHAEVSEKLLQAQQDNHQWEAQNQQLKTQVAELQGELGETQTELTAANAMLIEFRAELGNWKKDVIGNRREIRKQHDVEMEALYKILVFLGGEIPESTLESATTSAPVTNAESVSEEFAGGSQK